MAAEDDDPSPGSIAVGARAGRDRHRPAAPAAGSTRSSTRCVVSDLRRWCGRRTGTRRRVDALRRLAQIVLIDSQDEPDRRAAFARADDLTGDAYVVDLAWLRSTPWRERIAAAFDPPPLRRALRRDRPA